MNPLDIPEAPSTIPDEQWTDLQHRAIKANPRRVRVGTDENVKATRAGARQYHKRHQS